MDRYQRSKRYFSFGIAFCARIGGFCLFYLFLIRPIQTIIVADIIVPEIQSYTVDHRDFIILANQDDYLIESHSDRFINLFFNLPFNGYFWLALILLFYFGRKPAIKFVFYYNLALFIIHPIFIYILLNENYWIAPVINAHEIVYKALFLSLGVIAIKEGYKDQVKIEIMKR